MFFFDFLSIISFCICQPAKANTATKNESSITTPVGLSGLQKGHHRSVTKFTAQKSDADSESIKPAKTIYLLSSFDACDDKIYGTAIEMK